MVTRSLGDAVAVKLGVLSEPEIFEIKIQPNDRFFVLGTDGLWDGIGIEEAITSVGNNILSGQTGPQKASEDLIKLALVGLDSKELDDNITNIVVFI